MQPVKPLWTKGLWLVAVFLWSSLAGGCGLKSDPAQAGEDADYIAEAARDQTHIIGYDTTGFPVYGVDENGQPVYKPKRK